MSLTAKTDSFEIIKIFNFLLHLSFLAILGILGSINLDEASLSFIVFDHNAFYKVR
jgi:hypothetical protein